MSAKRKYTKITLLAAILLLSCNADEETIFDAPNHDNLTEVQSKRTGGRTDDEDDYIIQIYAGSGSPIGGAIVQQFHVGPDTLVATDTTDSDGEADFSLPDGDYLMVTNALGYFADSLFYHAATDSTITREL